jgi:type II secretory pathway component PulC
VQSVAARTAGAVAGLREDDVITWVDGTDSPTPQRIVTLWTGLEARQSMMLRIERAGEPLILAIGKP